MSDVAQRVKLTSYSHGAGCACKLGMSDLRDVLGLLGPPAPHDDVLVGLDEADDAAVVRFGDGDALVLTLDFFTPLVDDAYTWGQIAAANASSDVYAMGGRPIVALNIAAWPRETLPIELLADVLRGGRAIAERGGYAVVGGHTIDDPEPKYGQVVVGRVDPERMMTIDRARPGDVLVLTKSLGTGVITTAIKKDAAPPVAVDAAVESMTTLNDTASAAFVAAGVRACTDVTGFGLLGHLHRMGLASSVGARLDARAVPALAGVRELIADGSVPGGTRRNLEAVDPFVEWSGTDEAMRVFLADAQTSGGLLAACAPEHADALADELNAAVVGSITDGPHGSISIA